MKLLSTLLVASLAASAAWAQPMPRAGGPHGPAGRGPAVRGMVNPAQAGIPPLAGALLMHQQQLNLTEDQINRLRTVHVNMARELIRRNADLQVAQLDLANLLVQPTPNRSQVEANIRETNRLRTELQLVQARAYMDALAILTPQQREMLRRMVTGMMAPGAGCPTCPPCPMMGGAGARPAVAPPVPPAPPAPPAGGPGG